MSSYWGIRMIRGTRVIGTVDYKYYDEDDNEYTIEEVLTKLNNYEALFDDVRGSDDFEYLLGLMQDYNLTWKGVTNIIKEALDDISINR